LDELATGFEPPIQVSPYTDDYDTAVEWFTALAPSGVEGLVAKGAGTCYKPGERGSWVKVKHRSQVDGIVGAVIGSAAKPEAIVVGRYTAEG
jgi:ATP-dependent DNA ligase